MYWGRRLDTMGAEMLYNASSARLFESVESVESVAFLLFGPIRSESGGKLLSPTSDYTRLRGQENREIGGGLGAGSELPGGG